MMAVEARWRCCRSDPGAARAIWGWVRVLVGLLPGRRRCALQFLSLARQNLLVLAKLLLPGRLGRPPPLLAESYTHHLRQHQSHPVVGYQNCRPCLCVHLTRKTLADAGQSHHLSGLSGPPHC